MPLLTVSPHEVAVRMYRIGHGDCFLLAFPREGGGNPVYVLVDCGYKPGSPTLIHSFTIGDIVDDIVQSTGGVLDLVILTHEHQDHLNGIWKQNGPYFDPFTVGEAWLAWTEDPDDDLANELRRRHRDQLLGLVAAREKLALAEERDSREARRLERLLAFELGGGGESMTIDAMLAAASDPRRSVNKQALKLIRDKAEENRGVRYLVPGQAPLGIDGCSGLKVFVLGPPHDAELIADEDPQGSEAFPLAGLRGGLSFGAAASAEKTAEAPFRQRHRMSPREALGKGRDPDRDFFVKYYGRVGDGTNPEEIDTIPLAAPWRRIDTEWLYAAESLALKLNTGINNTSLVLAFELEATKKVLLFAGDAQRGNWVSWTDHSWPAGSATVDARDLLARTVLYKVGHHGSHNATLNGSPDDPHPNLSWMGTGPHGGEFVAMITAVNQWALENNDPPWRHPLPSIRRALLRKAQGRVFQTDIATPRKPKTVSAGAWNAFKARSRFEDMYFEYRVPNV